MKYINLNSADDYLGLSAATEGLFGDIITKIADTIKGRKKFHLEGVADKDNGFTVVREKLFDQVLKVLSETFEDPDWSKDATFKKEGISNSSFHILKQSSGKHDIKAIPGEAKTLLTNIDAYYRTEQPFIELRKKLFKEHHRIKDTDELSEWWDKNKSPLMKNFTDRYKPKNLKFHGFDKEGAFCYDYEDRVDFGSLWWNNKDVTTLPAVNETNCQEYVSALKELINIFKSSNIEEKKSKAAIPYHDDLSDTWDSVSEPTWTEMTDYLTRSQTFGEVSDLYYSWSEHILYQITAICVLLQKSVTR